MTPDSVRSLQVIRGELDIERAYQERRNEAADTRAGVIVGFASVIATIAINTQSWWITPGVVCAMLAACVAASIAWPRRTRSIDLLALRMKYLARDEADTQLRLLDTRIENLNANTKSIDSKYKRIQFALIFLLMSVVLLPFGYLAGQLL